ncbi:unnamed protein product [Cuscuta campestris]|uniref:Retrotransposon gag domain-containing protein n=1 Tax=Cuscuta campestris TaxID=132261 RepID=A0A484L186_9ASTE|nr:unnamed protein product [Cuscuta campestris]
MRLRSGRVIGDIEVNGSNFEASVSEPKSFNSEFVAESEDRPANLLAVDLFDSCSDSIFDNLFEINSEPKMTTLRELAAPNLNVQPLSITYAELEKPLKLNSGFINLLPKFHGLPGEDPFRHISEFLITCGAMVPEGVAQDQIRLRAFPFSLVDKAKDWLYYMPAGSFTTWNALHKAFLEKYFPASRIGSIRKEICGIKQMIGENFSEYWERFNKLCASCPQHQISEQLLIQYFYEGLLPTERGNVDAASGGALVNKTPEQARKLFNLIAQNTQQFGTRETLVKKVNEIGNSSIENKLTELTNAISQLTTVGGVKGKPCGVCCLEGHPTDACPTLQHPEVNANQRKYDPFSNSYNEGWRDHPNLRYGNGQNYQAPRGNFQNFNNPSQQPSFDKNTQLLEQILKKMDDKFSGFDQTLKQMQEKQSATEVTVSNLQAQLNNRFPSQPFLNPKENLSAIELRNKKKLQEPSFVSREEREKELHPNQVSFENNNADFVENEITQVEKQKGIDFQNRINEFKNQKAPFPSKFLSQQPKAKELDQEMLETFKKVEINLPLLEAIRQVPKYAKFLKELCTHKNKLSGTEKVLMSENISAVFQNKLPQKCKDPGVFTVPCQIGSLKFDKAMLDLGSSINVMPKDIFEQLHIGDLKRTGVVIQLADRSHTYPEGILEDVLQ